MGWSKHHKQGLIYHAPQATNPGYTLITTTGGKFANLIDLEGRICHQWQSEDGIGSLGRVVNQPELRLIIYPQPKGVEHEVEGAESARIVTDQLLTMLRDASA